MPHHVIVFLNGAFGIGKTTVARALVKRLPRAVLFDPEPIGVVLQRIRRVDDFQDLALWRHLTILGIRIARLFARTVVVPMAFSNPVYLQEIRNGLSGDVRHFCLVAPVDNVLARLRRRRGDAGAWEERRAHECCAVHGRPEFAVQIDANREPSSIVEELLGLL